MAARKKTKASPKTKRLDEFVGRRPTKPIRARKGAATRVPWICRLSNGIIERRHTNVPIGRPVGGGRPGRREPGGPSASYESYLEKRRNAYGLTELGKREEEAKARREKERREARLKKANERAQSSREKQKRKAAPKKRRAVSKTREGI